MIRLAPVGIAIAFAAAFLASPALARPHEFPSFGPSKSYDDDDDDDRRSYARERRQRRNAEARQRRQTAKRTMRRGSATTRRSVPVSRRGLTSYATGGAGGSRSCLTGATRSLLGRIEAQFGRIQVISTCRRGAVIAGSGRPSKHASGQAIDFNAPSRRKGEVVRWLIANHKSGGIMTYSGMNHIHVDIGYRFLSLNSRSGG